MAVLDQELLMLVLEATALRTYNPHLQTWTVPRYTPMPMTVKRWMPSMKAVVEPQQYHLQVTRQWVETEEA